MGKTLGSFSIDDGDGSENVTFKMNFVAFTPIRRKCQMWAYFPGGDLLGTELKFI